MSEESNSIKELKNLKPLSASKIKVLESCSWIYWCENHLRLPKSTNSGALRGTTVHNIFEILLNKRHIKHFTDITKNKTIKASKAVNRLILKYFKLLDLQTTEENLRLVDEMIVTGLSADFFTEGRTIVSPEYKFDIFNKTPKYSLRGFMDKISIDGNTIQIEDYKSSKEKFKSSELENNIQGLVYSLACKKLWPNLKPFVRFIFLRHEEDPIQKVNFTDETLKGFEFYLEYIQNKIENFTEKDAKSGFAFDKDVPKGEFGGKIMCGFCKTKGELKLNGEPKWSCLYRFNFDYYVLIEDDKVIKSIFEQDKHKIALKENQKLEKRSYFGCPRFK